MSLLKSGSVAAVNAMPQPIPSSPLDCREAAPRTAVAAIGSAVAPPLPLQESSRQVLATMMTTLVVFAIFFIQGVMLARILGPLARGEFGSALYFPRDLLLYVGLLGAIEMVAATAGRGGIAFQLIRRAALRLALRTSSLTMVVAVALASIAFVASGKTYLIPYCLLVTCFLRFEHLQLIVGAADRGRGDFRRYNRDRLIFAASFPLALAVVYGTGLRAVWPGSDLTLVCILFVASRVAGVIPTLAQDFRVLGWGLPKSELKDLEARGMAPGQMLARGRPYALSMLATEMFERLDIFLIVVLASMDQAGHYFVAIPIAAMLTIIPNSLGLFAFNAGVSRTRRVDIRAASLWIVGLLSMQVVSGLALGLALPWIVPPLYGSEFDLAISFAMWLLPVAAIKGFLQFADGFLKGRDRAWIGIYTRVAAIALSLGTCGLAWASWGVFAIPLAACAGQVFSLLVIVFGVLHEVYHRPQRPLHQEERQ